AVPRLERAPLPRRRPCRGGDLPPLPRAWLDPAPTRQQGAAPHARRRQRLGGHLRRRARRLADHASPARPRPGRDAAAGVRPNGQSSERASMSPLRIYGIARTRAFRALWIAKELGLDYEHVPIEIGDAGARTAAYLAVNPN